MSSDASIISDSDIASKMLFALMADPSAISTCETTTVPLDEQKRYLLRWINVLSIEDRKSIGNVAAMNDYHKALRACSEGTVINLDTLPPTVVEQMYNLMVYKRSKKNQSQHT